MTNSSDTAYAFAAASRGADLLDARVPNWVSQIDLETLDMCDGAECVLGQLFRTDSDDTDGYAKGRAHLFAGQGHDQMMRQACEFGFNYTGGFGFNPTTGRALDEAWTNIINARREKVVPSTYPAKSGQSFMVSWHGGDEPTFFLTDSAAEGYAKFAEWLSLADVNDCLSILTIFEGMILETVTRFGE